MRNIGRLISILHRQSQIYINYALKDYNITSAECAFILYLARNEGVTQDEMSSYLYINKSATTRAIKSLENKGYVIKCKDNNDKRCNRIYMSDLAKKNIKKIIHKVHLWSDFLSKDLDTKTHDLIVDALEKIVDKVENTNLKRLLEVKKDE